MPRCLTILNSSEKQAQLDDALFFSDFSDELESYYREGKNPPDIDLLVSEINTQILPQFLGGEHDIDDVLETVQDPENMLALRNAYGNLLQVRRQINLKAAVPKDLYAVDMAVEVIKAIQDTKERNINSQTELRDIAAKADDAIPMSKINDDEPYDNSVHERVYQNLRAYRNDRFKGSSSMENIVVSKFFTDAFLKNAFIDVANKKLVDQTQRPGEQSKIDTNLKTYRKNLLQSMVERLNIEDTVNDIPVKLEFSNTLLTYKGFTKALQGIANEVMQVRYKGEVISLDTPGKLFEITEEYKRTGHPELKAIVDNFSDYVILSDFNKLFEYYGEGAIDVSKYNDDFDETLRKYSTKNALSVDAINASWDEKVQNGVQLTAPLYKTLLNNTEIHNYTTGKPTGKFLYPTLVANTFAPHFDNVDRMNPTESIRQILMDNLTNKRVPRTEKNILYTLYKKFFERTGDPIVVDTKADGTPRRNTNTTIESFHDTIRDHADQSLMLLVTKPLMETAKVNYIEAIEGFDGNVKLSNANVKDKTGVTFTSSRFIENNINKSQDDMLGTDDVEDPGFIKKYNIKFLHDAKGSGVRYISPANGIEYELRDSGNKVYDIDTIKTLSKDLLGLDFNNDRRHAEFWEEIQSLAENDGEIAPVFLSYIKDALDIVEAKVQLYNPTVVASIREAVKTGKSNPTSSRVINEAMVNDRYFNTKSPADYKFKLNTQNAKTINDLIYTAENNYTGNQLKSVVSTVEGTTVAGYGKYTYALGLKQNLDSHRRTLRSVIGHSVEKSPLSNNIFLNDREALSDFFVRGAAKVGDVVKGNSSQTDLETLHFNVNLGYFGRLKQALDDGTTATPIFDTLVFSDKSVNPLAAVNNSILRPASGRTNLFLTDGGVAVDENVSKQLLYETSGQYYRAYGQNILDTWESVFTAAGYAKEFNDKVNSKKLISTKLQALNELNEGDSPFWKSNTFEHGLTGYEAARFYADKANVALNNWVHFDNSTKTLGPKTKLSVKSDLIKNIAHYDRDPLKQSSGFADKYAPQLVKFANDLVDMKFKLSSEATQTIKKMYPELDLQFGGGDMPEVTITPNNIRVTKVTDINPAIRKFFYDHNLVRENLTNIAQGTAYAHKGSDENKQQLTQNKRNVNMTASISNYTLGLERGVEDFTRTAFVDDLVYFGKGILGNSHPIVVYDGASFETMSQRIKTQNSLNAKFNGDGGTVHKSFISHYDPNTGSFAETKHAAFAMTNEMIRQSQGSDVDFYELHKHLYDTDISTVDITKSWKEGINLKSFDDVYYFDRKIDTKTERYGTLYKLDAIEYLGKDADGKSEYNVISRNMSSDSGTQIKTKRNIGTMFDLWETLGGIDSVEHTDEKTNHFYFEGKTKKYYTGNHRAAEKLVDFEAYIGNGGERHIPESYIDGSRPSTRKGYETYKKLFNTRGVVDSHLELIGKVDRGMDHTALALALKGHDTNLTAEDFTNIVKGNKDNLQDLAQSLYDTQTEGNLLTRPYQRFKGKNIDRISFAGAQKVGQYNLNSIETVHTGRRAEWMKNKGTEHNLVIPGVTHLITHNISNFNAGIQLNAWHETENAAVTTPTQMLNALIFNAKKLGKVQEMYAAIGSIVDKELTYALDRKNENIPELVRGLSNKEFYAANKDKLLRIFKDIMENKVAKDKDAEFTLESTIVEMFNHHDFPIDDPQIFHSAVAELTNYFTKSGIRTQFDGMFAVLAPASDIFQLHDVKGGFIPVKNERGGFDKVALDPDQVRTMQKAEYNQYKVLNDYLAEHDPDIAVREHASKRVVLNEKARDLKGQQVHIKYADGTSHDLSMLNDGETHMIPEARALDIAKTHIADFNNLPGSEPYKVKSNADKVKELEKQHKLFLKKIDELATNPAHPEIKHAIDSFTADLNDVLKKPVKGNIFDYIYENFSQSKAARDRQLAKLKEGTREYVWQKEHEYFDKLNIVNQLFVGRLQKFLDHVDRGYIDNTGEVSHVPMSLRDPAMFVNAEKLQDAKIEVTRAECIAPITARKAFMLREGDSIGDITPELFKERLYDTLDYFDVNADAVLISKSGKRIFMHKGSPAKGTKANDEHENMAEFRGKKWFTNDSGDRLFQVPDNMLVTNINGTLHAFLNDQYDLTDNLLTKSLDLGFGRQGDKFTQTILGSKEDRLLRKAQAEANFDKRANEMYSSWKLYCNKLIGTRVPGQHFQSFQGMKIVGFSEGNNIHTAKEVIDLSGADFDIDKQNIIYHSIDGEGRLETWHPAADLSTPELLEESLKLPMPQERQAADFVSEKTTLGDNIDRVIDMPDITPGTEVDIPTLLGIYHMLEEGYKLDEATHPNLIAKLVEYDNAHVPGEGKRLFDITIGAIKNFAVSSTNQIIEAPSNFLYLSNGVSTDTIKQFSSRTAKAETANDALKENPHSQSAQKYENMVGKMGIGIMASQMKVLSTIQYTTNTALKQISDLRYKLDNIKSLSENYNYHLNAIHDVAIHYTGPHTQEQLEAGLEELKSKSDAIVSEVNYLQSAIGGNVLSLPNINYDLIHPNYGDMDHEGLEMVVWMIVPYDSDVVDGNNLNYAKLASTFQADLADLNSQLLSTSTDNAKELDLGKINATPDLMSIMPSMGLTGRSFGEMIDVMTSPISEMLLRNATKNVYSRETSRNSVANLLVSVKTALKPKPSPAKSAAIERLLDNYNLRFMGEDFADVNTREVFTGDELLHFRGMYYKPAQMATLLAKYLGINQGIASNNWDLYSFSTTLQDTINSMFSSQKMSTRFSFKSFLDSLATDGSYHKTMIRMTSPMFNEQGLNYNPLFVLSVNPHFAKQLTAFNSSNTILRETSYRVNSMYHMTDKLRDIGYLRENQNIQKKDFQQVESFIESSILHSFIKNEAIYNKNADEKPLFFKKNTRMDLSTVEGRKSFIQWMQTDFMRDLGENPALKGNQFAQDLRTDSKNDPLLFNDVDFMKLQMDTTNVKSNVEQGPFRDAYVSGLKDIYDNKYTDLNNNNIFNALFWYNLIVNKNNITKNSYAKLLGDVMWQDGPSPNVYSRLFLLKGKIGKSTKVELNLGVESDKDGFYKMSIGGVSFNLKGLFLNHEIGQVEKLPAVEEEGVEHDYDETGGDEGDSGDIGSFGDAPSLYSEGEQGFEIFEDDGSDEGGATKKRNELSVTREKQKGVDGTNVIINLNGKTESQRVTTPSTVMPVAETDPFRAAEIGYNPFVVAPKELRPDQNHAYDFYKLSLGNIHELLSRLGDAVEVEIKQGDGEYIKFDRTKDYNC